MTIGLAKAPEAGGSDKTGPLIWWKLDETEGGTATNAAGQQFAGTIHGKARWAPGKGVNSGALELGGVKNWVEAVDSEDLDFQRGLTVATWFKVRKFTTAGDTFLAKGESWRLQHQGTNGTLEFFVRGPKEKKPTGSTQYANVGTKRTVDDNQWHCVVATYDGKRVVIYLDGAEENSVEATGPVSPNNLPVTVGENYSLPGRWFNGWLDDTRVYSRALSADEIKELAKK